MVINVPDVEVTSFPMNWVQWTFVSRRQLYIGSYKDSVWN